MIITIAYLLVQFIIIFAVFAVVQKPLFMIYNRRLSSVPLTAKTVREVYRNGYRSDLVGCAVLTVVPLVVCWLHLHEPFFRLYAVLTVWNIIVALLLSCIVLADCLLYNFWESKFDSSVFAYLKTPQGAVASVSTRYLVAALSAILVLAAVIFLALNGAARLLDEDSTTLPKPLIWHVVNIAFYLALLGILYLLFRGEGIRPNNPSMAYFSPTPFLNHCAVNPLHNFLYSLSIGSEYRGKFHAFDDDICAAKFKNLFPTSGTPQVALLTTPRPNILFLIWESLGACFVEPLGGAQGVTPHLTALAQEGVWFSQCYSSSFRTDRALPSLLCGIPAQPTASLIRHTRKLRQLVGFPAVLRDVGYTTMAVHGGDCTIMNKRAFYLAAGHATVVEQKDILSASVSAAADGTYTCKWGVHDGIVLAWLARQIAEQRCCEPWLITCQTLSSHEPFSVPYHRLDDKISNAFAYTDACLARLLSLLRQTSLWDHLLIIITGDHSIKEGSAIDRHVFAHVPMLWTGGAVRQPQEISTIMAHTDLPATLLAQMSLPHAAYRYSRDILADTYTYPFALHTYNNGFLFTDSTGATVYDNIAHRAIDGADKHREETAQVILQTLYSDLDKM